VVDFGEHGNEPSGSLEVWEFLDWLSDCQLLKKDSSAWSGSNFYANTRVVSKVHGLTFLLRVGTLWKCGDGLFFEVPPLASDALLTTLYPLLENVLQTVDYFDISCPEIPFHGWKNSEISWGEI
jgi:hypothetical protein